MNGGSSVPACNPSPDVVCLLQPDPVEWPRLLREGTFRGLPIASEALPSRNLVEQYLLGVVDAPLGYKYGTPFLIVWEAEGLIVGNIGGKGLLPDEDEVELGYQTAPAYEGRGIMTAALGAMQLMARQDGLGLLAHVERDNQASRRVLEKAGFTCEALVRLPASLLLERWSWSSDQH